MQTAITHIDYKTLYDEQLEKIAGLTSLNAELNFKIASLTHQLEQLQKIIFGSKHERFVPTDESKTNLQLTLDLNADTIAQCKITEATKVEYIRTKTQVTEVLDYIPGELYVKQYIRLKYVQPLNEISNTVITASLPGRLMEKCMAGEGLLAQIVVDKYVDHLPMHRQLQRFQRAGVTIAQSTISDWMKYVLLMLIALYELHKKQVLSSTYLHADETTIKVLDEMKKGKTHLGYYWVYHNSTQKIVFFDYNKGRGRESPGEVLKEYKGYLQTDGYAVYDDFDKEPQITLLHCM